MFLHKFKVYGKRVISMLIISVMMFSHSVSAAKTNLTLNYDGKLHNYSADTITLMINGVPASNLSMPPIIFNDYTLVPAREVFEPLNAVVDWNGAAREVYVTYENTFIILRIDNKMAEINGQLVEMQLAPKIINDKTMIPLRFVADSLNFLVEWNGVTKTASVSNNSQTASGSTIPPGIGDFSTPAGLLEVNNTNTPNGGVNINNNTISSDAGSAIPAVDVSQTSIPEETYPLTSITYIGLPHNGDNTFTITASSAISKVEKTQLPDNRMCIDIYNSTNSLDQQSYLVTDNPTVASVRTSQFQITPVLITRVVFDLKDGAEYSVSISSDRRSIFVGFRRNTINNVEFSTDGMTDRLVIYGETTPVTSIFQLYDPDRIVIDVPYATMNRVLEQAVVGAFVSSIRTAQFDSNTARIVLDLTKRINYDLLTDGNTTTITLASPTYKNVAYDGQSKVFTIKKDSSFNINLNQIVHRDDYLNFTYVLSLPSDLGGYLGSGEYTIRDSFINSITLRSNSGKTDIVINEAQVLAYIVTEDASNIYIKAVRPKDKYNKIVIIDPGHGGSAPGTSGNGLVEKNLNLDISNRLMQLLEANNSIKAYTTRVADVSLDLEERSEFANNIGDLFVSIHNNYAEIRKGVPNTKPNGTEVYYYPHSNDDTIGFTSKSVAEIMQRSLVNGLGAVDRDIKSNTFVVLTTTRIPAVLCEIGFLSNVAEAQKLSTAEYRQKTAQSLYNGIIETMEKYTPRR